MSTAFSIQSQLHGISQAIRLLSISVDKKRDSLDDDTIYKALKEYLPKIENSFKELKVIESEVLGRLEIDAITRSDYEVIEEEEQKWLLENPRPGPEYIRCGCGSAKWCSKETCG